MRVFDKIYLKDKNNAYNDILSIYNNQGYCIVNFLYFANLVAQNLDKDKDSKYYKALIQGNLLLPDGIALYLFYLRHFKIKIFNLNGTDFLPFFINKYKDADYILYGASQKSCNGACEYFRDKFNINPIYCNHGYDGKLVDLDVSKIKFTKTNRVLLVALGTPLQENWILDNIDYIKQNNLLVFSVGGLFDFLSGVDKRSPLIFRKMKLEWLWRFITNPKKNYKKVLNSLIIIKMLLKNKI